MLRNTYYDKNEIRVLERNRVNLQEYYDVEFWSRKFGITPELLKMAVKASGSDLPEVVQAYVQKNYRFK